MGKVTGFLEFDRKAPNHRDAKSRIGDWGEFYKDLPEKELKNQGARCMDCGVPFCHEGTIIAGQTTGCPINNLIPEWNDMVYRGLWKEALELLEKTNNFPEFTGRICPAPCEGACVLGINEPPVIIKSIENAIIEKGFANGWVKPKMPSKRSGKKVAIVGSGPAGLACAEQLNRVGHQVTVFEKDDRIGGLLMYGIPNMKLDKNIVNRRIKLMEEAGINFVTNTEVGVQLPVDVLMLQYDSVVLCVGALEPRDVSISGRELEGIHFAMEYLNKNTKSLLDSNLTDGQYIDAKDKHVIIIGGGDTGSDCIGTAVRQGCKSVRQFQIHERPPNERSDTNPWPESPDVYLLDYAQKEAKAKFGDDPREHCSLSKQFQGENGKVKAIELIEVQWEEQADGTVKPVQKPGTEHVYPADLVLISIGYRGPWTQLIDQLGVAKVDQSHIRYAIDAQYGKYETNVEGVFAAGDARRGQSLVVWAINEGREAARECDRYLMGQTTLP